VEAEDRFLEFQEAWGEKNPAVVRLWENAWAEFTPFLPFDREIRRSRATNTIESVNARIRKAMKARGHFRGRTGSPAVRRPRGHGLDRDFITTYRQYLTHPNDQRNAA